MTAARIGRSAYFNLIRPFESMISRYSEIGPGPLFESRELPGLVALEEQWPVVLQELRSLLEEGDSLSNLQALLPSQAALTRDDRWKVYFLHAYGRPVPGHTARCPRTAQLLARVPGMLTAFFSLLEPGKSIPSHRGIFNGTVRCHLPLVVPRSSGCFIRIAGRSHQWKQGKCLVFDDTYPHEVRNDTGEARVVLLIDLLRPTRYPASVLSKAMLALISHSGFVRRARRRLGA